MNRRHIRQWAGAVLLLAVMVTSGCKGGNIFGFRGGAENNVGDLIAKGQEHLRDNEFDEALATFAEAVAVDSLNSDARFFHAKATLLATGESIVELLRSITDDANTVGGQIPFYSPDQNLSKEADEARKTRLYQAAFAIAADLEPISQGLTRGSFDATSVGLDLAIAQTIFGILQLRDTNENLEIRVPPDFFFDIRRLDNDNFSIDDFADAILDPSLTPAEQAEQVVQFNGVISDLAKGDPGALSIVERILLNLEQSGLLDTEDSGIDVTQLEEAVEELGDSATFFFINNGVPGNDGEGDNDGDGLTDEELLDGIDNDGDGLVDEDSHFP